MTETTPSANSLTDDIADALLLHCVTYPDSQSMLASCECKWAGYDPERHLASIAASVVSARAEALAQEIEGHARCQRGYYRHLLDAIARKIRKELGSLVADKETGDGK